jgi:DNA-binding transcriptional LysR family regulator
MRLASHGAPEQHANLHGSFQVPQPRATGVAVNKFSDMSTFVTVVEAASFSEAGRRLGTTKSLVSQRMQQLEKRLGVVLLTRGRPLKLTEAGQLFYADCTRILLDLARADGLHPTLPGAAAGALRPAIPATVRRHGSP